MYRKPQRLALLRQLEGFFCLFSSAVVFPDTLGEPDKETHTSGVKMPVEIRSDLVCVFTHGFFDAEIGSLS